MNDGMGELRLSPEQEQRIAAWLQKVKFRKQIFGGVSESDVWKKIGELNDMYRQALIAERARYDALLAERTGQGGPSGSEGDGLQGGASEERGHSTS